MGPRQARLHAVRGYGPSSYGDGFAEVYDDWYDDLGDAEACASAVLALAADVPEHGQPPLVLELGIGTGRLALPLADAGLDVRGIDASAAMVDRLRAKRSGELPVHIGDFADVVVPPAAGDPAGAPPPVDVVLCACNSLFNLTTEAAQRRCLAGVALALRPGGVLVVEAFVPARPDEVADDTDRVRVRNLAADRVVLTAAVHDVAAQTMAGQYVDITGDGVRLRPWALRYLHPDQLDALAADVGLVLVSRRAGWADEPFDDGADRHVSVYARRPSAAAEPSPGADLDGPR